MQFIVIIDHVCDLPGCRNVVVIDGNMKNARQVCSCKNIVQLHFDGMDGGIVVGTFLHNVELLCLPDVTYNFIG